MWACWFQFLCREPERDRAVVRSLLSHIFPLHSELAHAHNYPCNRYQALFFTRPSVRSLRTRKIRPGDEASCAQEKEAMEEECPVKDAIYSSSRARGGSEREWLNADWRTSRGGVMSPLTPSLCCLMWNAVFVTSSLIHSFFVMLIDN